MAETTVPKKRNVISRSKNGCTLCKSRRIKCGEEKPGCHRCEISGWTCKYEAVSAPPLPFSKSIGSIGHSHHQSSTQPTQLDPKESYYFEVFLREYPISLTQFDTFFWKSAAVEESHFALCIRHTLVALGALIKSTRNSFQGIYNMDSEEGMHWQFAVEQHHKAICALQKAVSSQDSSNSKRSIIISCLVLVPLESFIGISEFIIHHVRYVRNVLFGASASNEGRRSPIPALGQDEDVVMQLFFQFDMQVLGIIGADEDRSRVLMESQVPSFSVPTFFKDIQEAEMYKKRILQHGNKFWYWVSLAQPSSSVPQSTKDYRDHLVHQINIFNSALDCLVGEEIEILTHHPLQRPSSMKLQLFTLLVKLSLTLDSLETTADHLLLCFQYIVSMCQEILDYERSCFVLGKQFFLFEYRVIGPLFLTATKCRDGILRRQAISLLQYSHRREMMWDSRVMGHLANWIMQVEEEGMDMVGFIPDERRVWGHSILLDLQREVAIIKCKIGRKAPGQWVERMSELPYNMIENRRTFRSN